MFSGDTFVVYSLKRFLMEKILDKYDHANIFAVCHFAFKGHHFKPPIPATIDLI